MPEVQSNIGYAPAVRWAHWAIVILVVIQFVLAWTMPDVDPDTMKSASIQCHFWLGLVIAATMVVRLAIRFANPAPPSLSRAKWRRATARAIHSLFYVLLIVAPGLGFMAAICGGWKPFGWRFTFASAAENKALASELVDAHSVATLILLVVIAVHVAAALYSHFVERDRTLIRMLRDTKTRVDGAQDGRNRRSLCGGDRH
jgi:cytochrome b561